MELKLCLLVLVATLTVGLSATNTSVMAQVNQTAIPSTSEENDNSGSANATSGAANSALSNATLAQLSKQDSWKSWKCYK